MRLKIFPILALTALSTVCLAQDVKVGKPKSVSLTIYNQNFALVKDHRTVELAKGRNKVVIEDVASQIDPTSVHFKSITAPDAVVVREQNYLYDLINPTTLLNKSVGKRVTIRQKIGAGQVTSVEGILLTPATVAVAATGDNSGGTNMVYNGMVIRTNDGRLLLNPEGEVLLHETPPGLIPRPELAWLVDSTQAGNHDSEISYMTNGVMWKADYVCVVSNDDKLLDVTGWVTLDNKSGATYENASLQLIAGDVRRVEQPRPMAMGRGGVAMEAAKAVPQFQEESFFEYHLYTLDGTTTVRENEQKQMTLLNANHVPAVKKFVYDGRRGFWGIHNPGYRPGEGYDTSTYKKVNVMMEVKNSKPNLGIPLPKGKVRMYKADSRGSLQFVGEDEIDHTPKDETLRLYVGDSFDMVGEHKRTDFKRIGPKEVEESFEIVVKNHRNEAATVSIIDHLWADWRITSKSHDYIKKDAGTVEFVMPVAKDGEAKVTYTVRTKWL